LFTMNGFFPPPSDSSSHGLPGLASPPSGPMPSRMPVPAPPWVLRERLQGPGGKGTSARSPSPPAPPGPPVGYTDTLPRPGPFPALQGPAPGAPCRFPTPAPAEAAAAPRTPICRFPIFHAGFRHTRGGLVGIPGVPSIRKSPPGRPRSGREYIYVSKRGSGWGVVSQNTHRNGAKEVRMGYNAQQSIRKSPYQLSN
jgi:hypothetical protein